MPPRKKAAAAAAPSTPPLDGCSIAISGTIAGRTQASIERDYINVLGATLAKSVTAATTHLVTTEADFEKPSAKVKSAQAHNVPIVSFTWLQDTLDKLVRQNENAYAFGSSLTPSSQAQPQPQAQAQSQTNGSRKRPAAKVAADEDEDEEAEDNVKSQPKKKSKASSNVLKKEEAKIADGQIAKSLDVRIPVDEASTRELVNYEVYIDDAGVIYDAALNQTNASNNNNKFYRIQLLRSVAGDYRTWTRWGRVGEGGQSKTLGDGSLADALREFDSKFRGKSGLSWANRTDAPRKGKYAFVERSYEPDSEDDGGDDTKAAKSEVKKEDVPDSTLPKPTQELMQLIFNQQYFTATMEALNYDSAKLPLGKLSKSTILKGYQALKDLSALFNNPSLATSEHQTTYPQATEELSNLFYTLIPHAFGRNRPPVMQNQSMLKQEIELLESLGDMKDAALLMKTEQKDVVNMLDRQFKGLGMNEMTPLSNNSQEFLQLREYLMETRGATHNANYQVSQIFRIERQDELKRFEAAHGTPRDRRLLWHGSRATNFGGILSQGLRIAPPEAPVSGYMFGKGIYLADMSSKSANYCASYITNGHALLLLCEAELGEPLQTMTGASYSADEDAKAKGLLSTWGQGMTGPSKWKDAECVHPSLKGVKMPDTTVKPGNTGVPNAYLQYNEYICYDISQVRLRYLLRVRM
ncbi:Uu.00g016080.m01.CDS01 [Anthostomella pinea]|uniref:Poly [ADP-ribose] polymerase n=1 Tax=Anthostomella pinea TaxID=933095 RepID=A0AAI8YQD5_9PEZI|nr:Uu.00g016080.m01.CDS01 [Anthostomella pinea]